MLPGSISGHVRDSSDDPLAGICVNAIGKPGGGAQTRTDSNGDYTLEGLAAETYRVFFWCDGPIDQAPYAPQSHRDQVPPSGDPIDV